MPTLKIVQQSQGGIQIGFLGFGLHGGKAGAVGQVVHDGDTVIGRALASASVRFLGVDTPEVSYRLPGETPFTSIGNPKWSRFLADPLAGWPAGSPLDPALAAHLRPKLTGKTAGNHAAHAKRATDHLRELVAGDLAEWFDGDRERFTFFLRYAREAIDGYGRLLAYLNVSVPKGAAERPDTYNERMLQSGHATPYFIWPNLDPFKKQPRLLDAVFAPGELGRVAGDPALAKARQWVRDARARHLGVFDARDPLLLLPFELRFLAGRKPPQRWVIDLAGGRPELIPPQQYHTVADWEDRLFVPEEYVELFTAKRWKKG